MVSGDSDPHHADMGMAQISTTRREIAMIAMIARARDQSAKAPSHARHSNEAEVSF